MPVPLGYESPPATSRPPTWVMAVVISYVVLLVAFVAIPVYLWFDSPGDNVWVAAAIAVLALMVSWFSLLWVPVRVARRRPVARRSLLIPIIGSGFLAGLLLFGLVLAVLEWATGSFDGLTTSVVAFLAIAGWIVWGIAFWHATANHRGGIETYAQRLARRLLAGSAVELLVAVPAHVVVRRRNECCAGIATGTGICCGLAVALVALGPGIFFLYRRRARDLTRPTPAHAV